MSIAFNASKISMNEFVVKKSPYKIIPAIGKIKGVKRPILCVAAYFPPDMRASSRRAGMAHISRIIEKAKAEHMDPYIIIGGDFNNFKLDFLDEFPDVEEILTEPTRHGGTLDKICTNAHCRKTAVRSPLETDAGTPSDHSIIYTEAQIYYTERLKKRTFKYKKYTKNGAVEFKKKLYNVDWTEKIKPDLTCPSPMALIMNRELQRIMNECFVEVTRTYKSNDAPWIPYWLKKKMSTRNEMFKKYGRRGPWIKAKKETEKDVKIQKKKFYDHHKAKLMDEGARNLPYNAVKCLISHERPQAWNVREMADVKTDEELAEDLAGFFNAISD